MVYWDNSLKIPLLLKKLKKSNLILAQNDFSALEYQLFCSRCVMPKENKDYFYAARTLDLKNDVYVKLIRYLTVWNVLHLLIWRFYNVELTLPCDSLKILFEKQYTVQDSDEDKGVIKQTKMKINEHHVIQRAMWTPHQRNAARNTRDYFLNNFEEKYPMLSDLPWTKKNNKMIKEFLLGLLKAKVSKAVMKSICCEQLKYDPTLNESELIHLDVLPVPEKNRIDAAVQRASITDFTEVKRDIDAAIKLQRFYRKRLKILKYAVQRIERAWEPIRIEIIETRIEIAEEVAAAADQLEAMDPFEYKELAQGVKDDYKTTWRPETRTNMYWIKVIAILAVPVAIGANIERWNGYGWESILLMVFGYATLQLLTVYRKLWKTMWFQTLALWLLTVIVMNSEINGDGWIRIPVWVAIVAFGRKYWLMLFLATFAIRVGLAQVYNVFSLQPVEYYFFIYDFYCIATIAAASREGTPIEMLHKVMINVVFLWVVAGSGALAYFYICVVGE